MMAHKTKRPLALIVAVARNGVIGKGGALPWNVPEDLRHFKRLTTGHTVIMGRKTHASIGGALPGRRNIVVTSHSEAVAPDCEHARTLQDAIISAYKTDELPFILGGAGIYKAALPLVTHIYWTAIDRDIAGDTYFPPFDRDEFVEVERVATNSPDVTFVTLLRKSWQARA